MLNAIDALARITKKGFDQAEENLNLFQEEFNEFKSETIRTVSNIDLKIHGIDGRLSDVQKTLEPMVIGYNILHKELDDLSKRLTRVEKKTGLQS